MRSKIALTREESKRRRGDVGALCGDIYICKLVGCVLYLVICLIWLLSLHSVQQYGKASLQARLVSRMTPFPAVLRENLQTPTYAVRCSPSF